MKDDGGRIVDAVDELLSIRAAELYYEENLTQEEIGKSLRITRWKVGRLLTQAKEEGFVRIEILHSRARPTSTSSAPEPPIIAPCTSTAAT
jgi:DNA-binding transcriptional regulator LsrR (DeoR family)